MPSAITPPDLEFAPLHPLFCAEVHGVDWTKPLPIEHLEQIQQAIDKYAVLVFRNTGLDDARHIDFASHFGPLDDMTPHLKVGRRLRLPDPRIFDVSNLDPDGNLITAMMPEQLNLIKGNGLWHADLAFNSRRAGYSILRGHKLPPPNTGGDTEYFDARTAYSDLPQDFKDKVDPLIANNSAWHNRKLAAPEFYREVDPKAYPMSRHRIVLPHDRSGRKSLYLTTYAHNFDGMSQQESQKIIDEVFAHILQPKYIHTIQWENDGDMIMWDNTSTLHRADPEGEYMGKYMRDMRRTTSFDTSRYAWGENDPDKPIFQGLNPADIKRIAE